MALTKRRQTFVDHFCTHFNATLAAKEAGFSKKSAHTEGWRLLKDEKVQAAIRARVEPKLKKLDLEIEHVVRELVHIAFSDPSLAMEWGEAGVRWKESKDLPEGVRKAIAEVSDTARGVRMKFHSKVKALELLGKYLGMFTDDDDEGPENLPEVHLYHPDDGRKRKN